LNQVGLDYVLVSGRPPRSVRRIADLIGRASGLAICCNGALVVDLATDEVVHHQTLAAEHALDLIRMLRQHLPGVAFAVERGLEFGAEPGYLALRGGRTEEVAWQDDAIQLSLEPITKLIAFHGTIGVATLRDLAQAHLGHAVDATYSGAGFLEVAAAGVDKASALAWLCAQRSLTPHHVVAVGDMINDLAMLRWAGRSIAVANAHPEVLAVVDEVVGSNDEDGVAAIIERLLQARGVEGP
jgi:hypothetical protein